MPAEPNPVAVVDRADELAAMLVPEGSPLILERTAELKEYFDALVAEEADDKPLRVLRRRWTACVRRLLRHQLAHDRARRALLQILDMESGATAEEVLAAIEAEQSARELSEYGRSLNDPQRRALMGLADGTQRDSFAKLIREDLVETDRKGFSTSAVLRRAAAAWLFILVIAGALSTALLVLSRGMELDPWFLVVFLVGTVLVCRWFSKDFFDAARRAKTAVSSARSVFGPKPVAPPVQSGAAREE